MPPKNYVKEYREESFYHLYNRGVAKLPIFLDRKDYVVFLRFLKEYLLPVDHQDLKYLQQISPRRKPINCIDDVRLLAYVLMPNHFHLLIKNLTERGLVKFMRALNTSFSLYFNKRYDRVGPVFQGTYKAVLIENEAQLFYVSKYIHLNPLELTKDNPLRGYRYSSYMNFLGMVKQDWLCPEEVLAGFSNTNPNLSYESFVEEVEFLSELVVGLMVDDKG